MIGDKKYFLIIAIVLILISIGGVWASDNQSATVSGVDDSAVVDEVVPLKAASVDDGNLTVENNDDSAAVDDSKSEEALGASNDEDVLGATNLPNAISASNINSYRLDKGKCYVN